MKMVKKVKEKPTQICVYNDPSVFGDKLEKFTELREARLKLEEKKRWLKDKSAWKGSHPWDIAIEIQQLTRVIKSLMTELKPVLVT